MQNVYVFGQSECAQENVQLVSISGKLLLKLQMIYIPVATNL